jgi:hypothetical protein
MREERRAPEGLTAERAVRPDDDERRQLVAHDKLHQVGAALQVTAVAAAREPRRPPLLALDVVVGAHRPLARHRRDRIRRLAVD